MKTHPPIATDTRTVTISGGQVEIPAIAALDGVPALIYRCTNGTGVHWMTDVVAVSRLLAHAPETSVAVIVVQRQAGNA